jgi:endonuclease/exonuclease/phosphatase family metal-dependent hydrolase
MLLRAVLAALALSLCVAIAPAHAAWPVSPPTNVHGVSSTQISLQVGWDAVPGESYYQVTYSTRSDLADRKTVKPVQDTAYWLRNLTPGTRYYFRVGVTDSSGNPRSDWSATANYSTRPLMRIGVGTYNIKDPDSTSQGPWTTRGPRSAAAIVGQGVQLLGVQEVFEDDDRTSMLSYINQKAGGAFYRMVPAPDEEAGQDSRVVFDQRSFKLLESGGASFGYQYGSEDRAFAWGTLEHRSSGRYLLFVTTHLSPRSDYADVRQWSALLEWVRRKVAASSVPLKVIITGDFNTTKFEPPASMLAASRSAGYEDVLGQIRNSYSTYRNPTKRVDAWISSSNRGRRDVREYSVATNRNSNSIDYIFVSKALKVPYYRVYAQPRTGYIMNYLMSDHFLVWAVIAQ